MNRRSVLKKLLSCGAIMTMPSFSSYASSANKPMKNLIMITASGGWDVTSICDPKGDVKYSEDRGYMNNYKKSDIRTAGNLPYAPIAPGASIDYDWMDHVYQNLHQHMVVVNGVNCLTGSHAQGGYYFSSGQSFANFPTIAALHSAPYKAKMAIPYYSAGAHVATAGEVSAVQINSVETINKLVNVNEDQPDAIHELLKEKRQGLLDHFMNDDPTPSKAQTWQQFQDADLSSTEIAKLTQFLPEQTSSGAKFQAEMCAALLASGQSAATAFKSGGGFDTHNDNDIATAESANLLFEEIAHLWSELERHNIADQTVIMIGSDFGRTPWYNSNNGKDHWSTGSVILMGKGSKGNKVIGASTDQLKPEKINFATLQTDENGNEITIQHIHRAVRDYIGLDYSNYLNSKYPMPVESINLFD